MEDFGSALTGQSQVEPAEASNQWDGWLNRPGNRAALLQMGLGLMQPVGIGQTPGGHIAQAIGGAGEAVSRNEATDLKERMADEKLFAADERLRIAQQNADNNSRRTDSAVNRSTNKKVGGLTDLFRARAARQDANAFEKKIDRDAKELVKQANDPLMDPNAEVVKKYRGKSVIDVQEDLRKTRPKPKFGTIPEEDDDDDDPIVEAPPAPGARLAPDGNYYMPDPKRPGKYLKVSQ